MIRLRASGFLSLFGLILFANPSVLADDRDSIQVDLKNYREECGVSAKRDGNSLILTWPMPDRNVGRIAFHLSDDRPLIESLSLSRPGSEIAETLLSDTDPAVFVTVGTREQGRNRPPSMSVFNEFFDNPARRPSQVHAGKFTLRSAIVASHGKRLTVDLGDLQAGPFRGKWRFTIFADTGLIQAEAIVTTDLDRCAFLYDLGLVAEGPRADRMSWTDEKGQLRDEKLDPVVKDGSIAVRHRAIALGRESSSLVITPPPHQFFFPRDYTDNVHTIWTGRGHLGLDPRFGVGIRQDATGGGNFVPWFNAPPGTEQHLSMFMLLSSHQTAEALGEMLAFTRGDRFAEMPGRITYTSHYHMAITESAIERDRRREQKKIPEFVSMFKSMGVNAVHLGEFHGDGHQYDSGPLRLRELAAMFEECRRLSDEKLLFLPGEEVAKFLGKDGPGRESGHWMSLFPKPVFWILDRKPGLPLVEEDPRYGTVYRVGSAADVQSVLDREHGLVWSAHPRIKASSWAPDSVRDEPYFAAETWLGAAWKAMPADLSLGRLGERGLNLLDDMSNWKGKKYLPGEVDVFKLDPSHELYGHMNINYLKVNRLPSFDQGWKPILDALRNGQFFTTTGEILIKSFTVAEKESGSTIHLSADRHPELVADVEGTYPPSYAEVISGDGQNVFRERISLDQHGAFQSSTIRLRPKLEGRKWVRFEIWDVAANGAYTQPIWIEED